MCNNGYTAQAVQEMQEIALQCGIKKLLASPAWQTVRKEYPNSSDIEVLQMLVGYEAFRLASKTVVFHEHEFAR